MCMFDIHPIDFCLKVVCVFFKIRVEEYEDLYAPFNETQKVLTMAKMEGCQAYVIFIANGIQTARLLRFGDRLVKRHL